MPKNAQTTAQLHSSHTLVKECSKFSKPGFSNTGTVNFQMFKLVLEKAEVPEIKLPTSAGSLKKQDSSRKNFYFCFVDYAKSFDCVDHNKLYDTLWPNGPQNARISCHAERHGFWKRWAYQTTWSAYRFLRRQFRWSGIPTSFRIFHSLLWSTQSKALA